MKNIKLIVGLLFIYSCSPVVTNTLPSPSSSPTKSPDITASPTSSINPSVSVSQITPISPNPSQLPIVGNNQALMFISSSNDDKIIKQINYIFLETPIQRIGTYYEYNMGLGESKLFIANLLYKDNIQDLKGFVWISSNPDIISVENGYIKSGLQIGKATIRATSKSNPKFSIYFDINLLESTTYEQNIETYDSNCKIIKSTKIVPIERYRCINCYGSVNSVTFDTKKSFTLKDHKELATFNGKVYDPNLFPVEGAIVNARSIDCGVNWVGQTQITSGGSYVFRNAPPATKIEITVTKDGWTTRTRKETLKSNLQGDPAANVFDFSTLYAIQDEPEVTQLKINGQLVNSSSNGDEFIVAGNSPKNSKPTPNNLDNNSKITNVGNVPSLTGVNSNTLDIEMTFSEPVRRDDIENYFRVISQSGFDNKPDSFLINNDYSGVRFEWSKDDTVVTFKTNKAILANTKGDEARYLLDFSQSFRDKTDRSSIDRRYFRFSPSQINDFAVFSVKNDEEAPKLLGITAKDGNSNNNDILELTYSEPMELINQASFPTGLVDFKDQKILSNQLISRLSNNTTTNNGNNATLLGYLDSSNGNTFKTSYMIGKILQGNLSGSSSKVEALGNTSNPSSEVNFVKSAKIKNNTVTLELDSQAFTKNDMVIVSVGKRIDGFYTDTKITKDLSVNLDSSVEFSQMYDPSGRLIDTGNSSTSANIDVNNSQRITLVN